MSWQIFGSGWATKSDFIDKKKEAAKQEQKELATQVLKRDIPPFDGGGLVTGVDVSYVDSTAVGTAVTMDSSDRNVIKKRTLITPCEFPYIPGYFHLREGPTLISLLGECGETGPVLVDANGILHPRRCGLASCVGLKSDKQTIGVAKSLLLGNLGRRQDGIAFIKDGDETVGAAVWLGTGPPVYVSIGHKVTLETAVKIVTTIEQSGKLEPIANADRESRRVADRLKGAMKD
ncbi:MAG: endonuclease V [Candidatus Lokiarchaeota archaeon]|nr:endonuclease V [Candidatus Lokiarchaeota archaeon]